MNAHPAILRKLLVA